MMVGVKSIPKDEKTAAYLCRVLKKSVKEGTIDENWEEVGDHHWLEFKGIGKSHLVISRFKEGRKATYGLQIVSEQGTDVDLPFATFDYVHTTGKSIVFKFGDKDDNIFLKHTVKF